MLAWKRDPHISLICVAGQTCLGLDVVGDVVNGASEGDFAHWPGSVVGQVGGQNADPQLALRRTDTPSPPRLRQTVCWDPSLLAPPHLFVEVEEAFGAVDVVEG